MTQADERRAQIYHQLRIRETLDLVTMWQAHDRRQWSDEAFDVMEQLIKERLGTLPAREPPAESQPPVHPDEIDQNADPEVRQLWLSSNVESLSQMLQHDPDWMRRLDAAQAMAHLGDERGDDFIDQALHDPAPDVRALARELRDWLDAGEDASGGEETPNQSFESTQPDETSPGWDVGADFPDQSTGYPVTGAFEPGPSLEQIAGREPPVSTAVPRPRFAGAAGGAFGLLAFYLALIFFNAVPPAAGGPGSWIWESAFIYLPVALGAGAALASLGRLVGSNTTDLVAGTSEENLAPVIGALALGGIGGFLSSALLFLFTQP